MDSTLQTLLIREFKHSKGPGNTRQAISHGISHAGCAKWSQILYIYFLILKAFGNTAHKSKKYDGCLVLEYYLNILLDLVKISNITDEITFLYLVVVVFSCM